MAICHTCPESHICPEQYFTYCPNKFGCDYNNEHDKGDGASMLRNVRRHHYVGEVDYTCSISGFDVKAEPNSDI